MTPKARPMLHDTTTHQADANLLPAAARLAAAVAATLYGFIPTGIVALTCAAAATARARRGDDPAAHLRRADGWLTVTVLVGAALELPVILAAV